MINMLETNYENKICFFDLETTGLNINTDRVTQIAWCICDLDSQEVLSVGMKYIYESDYPPITQEITDITGISEALLKQTAVRPFDAFYEFKQDLDKYGVQHLCAHNLYSFDGPLIKREMERVGIEWRSPNPIDTKVDIEYLPTLKTRGLLHLAAEHGFLPYQVHDALFDTLTLRKLFFCYDWRTTVKNAGSSTITIHISTNYDTREEAKKRGYYYDGTGKRWLKDIKENRLSEEIEKAKPFSVNVLNAGNKR